ncbi:hypothetical protein DMUE_3056 [Dictyocoela muelleri]|nr:hypothetical protein DMUE_3056 [Dictyocoela muelleri]
MINTSVENLNNTTEVISIEIFEDITNHFLLKDRMDENEFLLLDHNTMINPDEEIYNEVTEHEIFLKKRQNINLNEPSTENIEMKLEETVPTISITLDDALTYFRGVKDYYFIY